MALVNRSDLSNATSSLSAIDSVITTNQQMISQLSTFCQRSPIMLKGGGYDAVRSKINVYIDAFKKQNQIFEILKSNITAANNSLSNYMEEYTSLDDSQINAVKSSLEAAEAALAYLMSMLGQEDDYGGVAALIAQCQAEIARLKRLLSKLEGLAGADNTSYGMISGVEADINSYATAIDGIDVTTFSF